MVNSFRHALGTKLEARADTLTMMRAVGRSAIVVCDKHVHPAPRAMVRAFEWLNAANEKPLQARSENRKDNDLLQFPLQ